MPDHVARAEVHIDATPERVWSVLTAPSHDRRSCSARER